MARRRPLLLFSFICAFCFLLWSLSWETEAKKVIDPYKVLEVDKSASQRDIQKAFHKLSLKYHPDKNKSKGAQEKFAEINNAYEILSDEEKRKNFDQYGDEKGRPEFDGGNYAGGNFGGPGGYTFFTSSGPGNSHFDGRTGGGGWSGERGNSFFSFSGDSFGFDLGDVFNMFGGQPKGGGKSGGFTSSGGPNHRPSSTNIQNINSQNFKKVVVDSGLTWLLLFYTSPSKGYHMLESIMEEVSNSLAGAIKAGSINCQNEHKLCKDLGVWPLKSARLFVYSYGNSQTGSLIEYTSDFDPRSLKNFCQEHLPRLSKRVRLKDFAFSSNLKSNLPQVLLLSSKKDTPVLWRTLSGLYRNRFIFYDAQVLDAKDPLLKNFGVDVLPAVVGRMANGDVHVLKAGIAIKDLQTGLAEMRVLLDNFEKKNKKVASTSNARSQPSTNAQGKDIPFLSSENIDSICGEKVAVCIVGAFRSSKAKDKLDRILSEVSQKTLIRRQTQDQNSRDSIRYALLDASKQSTFLKSFDKSGFKNIDQVLLAYKPRRGKFAVLTSEITMEAAEGFISSVLNGDVQFSKIRQAPVLK